MLRYLRVMLVSALCFIGATPQADAESEAVLRDRINRGTVRIISGGVDGTYIRIASDLASVLDDGDNLRVLAILGKGSVQNIDDLLYLKGIDIGIVQSDVLTFVKRQRTHATIEQRLRYITKLYNEEFHLLANKNIATVSDLEGKQVNFGIRGSGTYMTASIVFETLGIGVEPVSFDQALALEKVQSGEIAAMVYVAGKPVNLFLNLANQENLHFLSIEYTPSLLETYLPSRFTHADYPELIAEGEQAQTVAVGAVMAVYNWEPRTPRYRKVSRFVETFFSRFNDFQQSPRHPKWKEVNLATSVPGWRRFRPAEQWLKENIASGSPPADMDLKKAFQAFLEEQMSSSTAQQMTEDEKDDLFQQFMRWYDSRNRQ